MGILTACSPRKDVLKSDLEDAIFAADFGDLIDGKAPPVYGDPRIFFQNTHPAAQLQRIVRAVFERLADRKEGGAAIRLSTGFGGGKTHTLMALWHLARHIDDPAMGTDLLPAAGRPHQVTVLGIDAGKGGVPEFAVHKSARIGSLWGELFWQLGGEKALKALGKADHPEASPSEAQIAAALPAGPVLILLDELVIYMAKLSERGQGNLLGFVGALTALVTKRPQTVLVVTDPAGQAAYAKQAAELAAALPGAAARLDEVLGRRTSDFDPIGDEAARVIVRRLFEQVDAAAAQAASATYHALYARVLREAPGLLPSAAATPEYARRIVDCYPFHPRLLDTATDRLGALQDFQKSRGVLRLFARIIRDAWEAREDLDLITGGDIHWASPRIQADLLYRLNRDNFKAAVSADVESHAGALDGGARRGLHRRVASALLLESLPLQSNSGLDPADLTLAVLRPEEAGPEPAEALDRLVGTCWHTYPMPGGRGWQFRYEPNILKQIEERRPQIPLEDARNRVLAEVQEYFAGPTFRLVPWPSAAGQAKEVPELQLALCETEAIARSVCAHADDADPHAPMPRRFVNAIVAVTATGDAFGRALDRAQALLAAEAIEKEHREGEAAKLVRDQLQRVKPDLHKQARVASCLAFNRVVLAGGAVYGAEEQFQVSQEEVMKRAHGQACLLKFLQAKGMIYEAGDTLDVGRFLKDVLPGVTPLLDTPEVTTAKAVHERFLSAPGLRLVPDSAIVRQTVLKAVAAGKLTVRLPDGRAYDAEGMVDGPDGARRRGPGTLTSFPLDETVLIAPVGSRAAVAWTQVGPQPDGPPPPPPPPPPPGRATATTWEATLDLAVARPLAELVLVASTPGAGTLLLGLAQPLGADTLTLSVTVGGNLKDGGTMNFMAADVKPTHPARPLQVAQTIANALAEGATYEAELRLGFGSAGRPALRAALEHLRDSAPAGLAVRAVFGPEGGQR